jgi:hypothetical protein
MEQVETEFEVCPCHGEPWAPNGPRRACRIKKQVRQRRWYHRQSLAKTNLERSIRRRNAAIKQYQKRSR